MEEAEVQSIRQVVPMCPPGMAHWRHLANTIEPYVCGGDVVLCQIILTACFEKGTICEHSYFLRMSLTYMRYVVFFMYTVSLKMAPFLFA